VFRHQPLGEAVQKYNQRCDEDVVLTHIES
jgi:hypothetical protein